MAFFMLNNFLLFDEQINASQILIRIQRRKKMMRILFASTKRTFHSPCILARYE